MSEKLFGMFGKLMTEKQLKEALLNVGYRLEKIGIYPEKEKKMTRQEAADIVNNNCFGLGNTGQASKWIKAFEALGLLKFEEENKIPGYVKITDIDGDTQTVNVNNMINALEKIGFKVTNG